MVARPLLLHQEVLLLALRDAKGTIAGSVLYPQAIGGAILADLIFQSRVRAERERRSIYVVIEDPTPVGHELLDECLARIAASRRRQSAATWVQRFAATRRLTHRVALALVERGVLRADEDTVLLLFKRRTYPEVDPAAERRIIARLEEAIFTDAEAVDPRTAALVALAHRTGLLRANFDRKRLKSRQVRLKSIVEGQLVGRVTDEVIQALQAVMLVTVILPAVMPASSGS